MKIERVECILWFTIWNIRFTAEREDVMPGSYFWCAFMQIMGWLVWGEAAPYGGPVQTTQEVIEREIAPMLIGEDPANTERNMA